MSTLRFPNGRHRLASRWIGLLTLACVNATAVAQEAPSFPVRDRIIVPWITPTALFLQLEPVQQELKLTKEQIATQASILQARPEKLRRARSENPDREKFITARERIFNEDEAAAHANLTAEQRTRLQQIQLQSQGPLAFTRRAEGALRTLSMPLLGLLKLSDDQVARMKVIVSEGQAQIARAARFPVALSAKDGPPPMEAIRNYVESSEFEAAKQKARIAALEARAAVMMRIEAVLSDEQRQAYHAALGTPFDLSKLRWGPADDPKREVQLVALALGHTGGQRADPTFDARVSRPAYSSAERHPRVLFDEAHRNFHTATGRYKPFAELITSDGYEVTPNREAFSRAVLEKGDILVIANATMPDRTGTSGEPSDAFTVAECAAVYDWVRDGGSLLLITDHPPFSLAAEGLAKRFGVAIGRGVASDPAHSKGGVAELVFTREDHLLGEHPITQGRDESERIQRVQTFAGTSLKGPEDSVALLKLSDTASERVPRGDGSPVSLAGRAQGLAFTFGQGRVVMLGEAAELSAQIVGVEGEKFGMNVPGLDNRQLALNIMHWLSGVLDPR